MENVILSSLTPSEIQELFRNELKSFFGDKPPHAPTLPEPELELSITELAKYLKCSKATVHAYKNRDVFPYYQTGRTVYFKKSEVDKALEVGKKKGART